MGAGLERVRAAAPPRAGPWRCPPSPVAVPWRGPALPPPAAPGAVWSGAVRPSSARLVSRPAACGPRSRR